MSAKLVSIDRVRPTSSMAHRNGHKRHLPTFGVEKPFPRLVRYRPPPIIVHQVVPTVTAPVPGTIALSFFRRLS